jgi:hypothetical protein
MYNYTYVCTFIHVSSIYYTCVCTFTHVSSINMYAVYMNLSFGVSIVVFRPETQTLLNSETQPLNPKHVFPVLYPCFCWNNNGREEC